MFPELRGHVVGHELDRKPTIEAFTADLPIRTAPECRVEYIAFLDRRPGIRAGIAPIGKEETQERLRQDMPMYDAELDTQRNAAVESIAEVPAFELRYSDYEDAVILLEQIVQAKNPA